MNEDLYAEWIVARKDSGYSFLIVLAFGVAILLGFISIFLTSWGYIIFVAIIIVVFFLFRYLKVEYEYIFVTDELNITKIFSQSMRKAGAKIPMSQVVSVEPTNLEKLENQLQNKEAKKLDFSSHLKDVDTYTIQYSDKGITYYVLFEPNEKVLQAMWRCSPSKVHVH